jgi:hypothetical protein
MFSLQFHRVIHRATNLKALESEARDVVARLGWRPVAVEIIGRISLVLAEHVIRHAGDGHFRMLMNGTTIEVVTEDRGAGFLRIYTAVREAGLVSANRGGFYEVQTPQFGDLASLRPLADELHIECEPGRSTTVRVVMNGEPDQVPHAPCPCLIFQGREERKLN